MNLRAERETPAVTMPDGHDYVKTNKYVLFGHHFAAIAAAGPLLGPVLAAQFGFLPGALWILIGCVLAGGVHDTIVLFASVRHKGKSLSVIAETEIGKVAGKVAAVSVLFILILTLAGLSIAVVNAMFNSPWGTFTVFATIPIAMIMGIYMHNIRPGDIKGMSIIGVVAADRFAVRRPLYRGRSGAGQDVHLHQEGTRGDHSGLRLSSPRCCRCGSCSCRATICRPI